MMNLSSSFKIRVTQLYHGLWYCKSLWSNTTAFVVSEVVM